MTKPLSIGELEWYRNKILAQEEEEKTRVHVCMTGCRAYGAAEFKASLEDEIKGQDTYGRRYGPRAKSKEAIGGHKFE